MNRLVLRMLFCGLLLLSTAPSQASNLVMVRTALPLEKALLVLKASVEAHGYSVSNSALTDLPLVDMGFEKPDYKVLTIEKGAVVNTLLAQYPKLAPFFPWRIALFVENGSTLLVSLNPAYLNHHLTGIGVVEFLKQSNRELRNILHTVGTTKP
jgi:uncharacterized protein (DUF302 family)